MRVAGVMSGTSVDAIDVALCDLLRDDDDPALLRLNVLFHGDYPLPDHLREEVLTVLSEGRAKLARLTRLNTELGQAFAGAVSNALDDSNQGPLDLIASHGQTIYHLTEQPGGTWQMGEPAIIAAATGTTTVSGFRAVDMAMGGEGAPLVPYFDALFLARPGTSRAAQNIGGIANVTFLPASGEPTAFDTGPGNMLIDEGARMLFGTEFDRDGESAARGQVDEALVEEVLGHPYFHRSPPKSTGRELFGKPFAVALIERARERGLSADDILATLTAITAESIVRAYRDFGPEDLAEVVVGGGGARNRTLMGMVRARLGVPVIPQDETGIPGDAKEAVAFAVLGYACIHGIAANVPACTGAKRPAVLGSITPGENYPALMATVWGERKGTPWPIRAIRLAG